MAQTRYLRTVIRLTIRERAIAAWHGRLAVSAVVYPNGDLREIKVGPFPGTPQEAEAWTVTGSRTAQPGPRLIPGVRS